MIWYINLHSNMDRLKPGRYRFERKKAVHLHSNMDRLKHGNVRHAVS